MKNATENAVLGKIGNYLNRKLDGSIDIRKAMLLIKVFIEVREDLLCKVISTSIVVFSVL